MYSSTATTGATASWTGTWTIRIEYQRPLPPPPPKRRTINAFAVLGLPDGASKELATQRYRQLAKVLHPDCGGDVKWMAVLNGAYEAIANA